MSINVHDTLEQLDPVEMTLRHGYGWRQKAAAEIMATWQSLAWHKRLFWSLRGRRPVLAEGA